MFGFTVLETIYLFFGLGLILTGLLAVHYVDKSHAWYLRMGSVGLSFLGFSVIWLMLALKAPVTLNKTIRLQSYEDGRILTEIKYDKVRDCTLTKLDGLLLSKNEKIKLANASFYTVPSFALSEGNTSNSASTSILTETREEVAIGIIHTPRFIEADSLRLEMHYKCPFGFTINHKSPVIPLSNSKYSFNLSSLN